MSICSLDSLVTIEKISAQGGGGGGALTWDRCFVTRAPFACWDKTILPQFGFILTCVH